MIDSAIEGNKSTLVQKETLPETALGRVATATIDALNLVNLAHGAEKGLTYDFKHPGEVAQAIGTCAIFSATLKLIMPEAGPGLDVALKALQAYTIYSGIIKPVGEAVSEAVNAKSMSDIHNAAHKVDEKLVGYVLDSYICNFGSKLGGKVVNAALENASTATTSPEVPKANSLLPALEILHNNTNAYAY